MVPRNCRRVRALVTVVAVALPLVFVPTATAAADGEIVYARSTDGGATFTDHVNLSSGAARSGLPHVAAAGGQVHVTWREGDPGDVMYRRSAEEGVAFGGAVNVSDNEGDSAEPDLALVGDAVHVVWAEAFIGADGKPDPEVDADEVYSRISVDQGASFGERVNLSASQDNHTRDPGIAAGGGVVVVAYEEELSADNDQILVRRSTDGGTGWDATVNVSDGPQRAVESAVAVSGSTVHVVFEARAGEDDDSDDRIGYARSTDGAASFAKAVLLPGDVPFTKPSVVAVGDVVHVVSCSPSEKTGTFDSELQYHRSTDGGVTWSGPLNLSSNSGECQTATVAAHGNSVWVAWEDSTPGHPDILLRRSTDGGASFLATQNVSNTRGDSEEPALAVDPATGQIHIVWTDYSVSPTGQAAGPDTPEAPPAPGSTPETSSPVPATAAGYGWRPPTVGFSVSATPAFSARPAARRSTGPSWAWLR